MHGRLTSSAPGTLRHPLHQQFRFSTSIIQCGAVKNFKSFLRSGTIIFSDHFFPPHVGGRATVRINKGIFHVFLLFISGHPFSRDRAAQIYLPIQTGPARPGRLTAVRMSETRPRFFFLQRREKKKRFDPVFLCMHAAASADSSPPLLTTNRRLARRRAAAAHGAHAARPHPHPPR